MQSLSIATAFNSRTDCQFAGLWYRKEAVTISTAFRRARRARLQDWKFCQSKTADGQPRAVRSQALSVLAAQHQRGAEHAANERPPSITSEMLSKPLIGFS